MVFLASFFCVYTLKTLFIFINRQNREDRQYHNQLLGFYNFKNLITFFQLYLGIIDKYLYIYIYSVQRDDLTYMYFVK